MSPERLLSQAFAFLWAATFFVFLSFYLLLPVLPVYALRQGTRESAVGLIIGVFALTSMTLKPWAGWALDWRGRRGILLAGAAIFCLASLGYPLARSTAALLLLRVFHGAGMGLFPTAGTVIVADLAPSDRRGEAMGLFGMAPNLAMAVGPPLGVLLEAGLGYPGFFLVGAVLAGIGTGLALLVPETGHPADPPPFRLVRLLAPSALQPALITLALFLTYGAVISYLPLLTRARQIGNPGAFFALMALGLLAVRTWAGQLSDRAGRRAVVLPSLVVVAAAMMLLATAASARAIYLAGLLFGVGVGSAQPTLMAWATDLVPPADRGRSMATVYTAWELGIGAGSIAFGLLLPLGGFEALFSAGGATALAGGALVLWRGGDRWTAPSR